MKSLISCGELYSAHRQQDLKILDASWSLSGDECSSLFRQGHIDGAQFFDLDLISDQTTSLPHMAPDPVYFAKKVGELGIDQTDTVIIYDRYGLFSAPRVWWLFCLMGHQDVRILDGGLPQWIREGLPISNQPMVPVAKPYRATFNPTLVTDMDFVRSIMNDPAYLILDARPNSRFLGQVKEPRDGVRSGHIPNSVSLPYTELLKDGLLRSSDDLRSIFETLGVDKYDTIVTTCGSGVSAAIINLALKVAKIDKPVALFDGSWAQWGSEKESNPIAL